MPLGFVIAGMGLGLCAAILVLLAGAGFGMAFLTYALGGVLGTGLAVLAGFLGHEDLADLPSAA